MGSRAHAIALAGVVFDFDGTLARCVAPWAEKHESVLRRHGLERFAAAWGSQWDIGPADGEEHLEHSASREAYRAWELDRLHMRAAHQGVPPACIEALVADLDRATKDIVMEAYDEVPAVLGELRRRGLVVAVCSNWYWDLDGAIESVGLAELVDVAVTSARAGARKPHPRIYAETLARCGLRPGEVLFVGDTVATDVEGALAAGMHAMHLRRGGGPDDEPPLPERAWRGSDLRRVLELAGG